MSNQIAELFPLFRVLKMEPDLPYKDLGPSCYSGIENKLENIDYAAP